VEGEVKDEEEEAAGLAGRSARGVSYQAVQLVENADDGEVGRQARVLDVA